MTAIGRFVSVWDDTTIIKTPCKVNLKTREVFDIEQSDPGDVGTLTAEYITVDGIDQMVTPREEWQEGNIGFWYE